VSKFLGFTLLEMLVTLFVIGLVAGWAVLSIHTTSPLEQESKKLFALLQLLKEESVLQHKNLGISFEDNSYRFGNANPNNGNPLNLKIFFIKEPCQ